MLTIVFKGAPVGLRLEGTKSNLASVAQNSALPMSDLDTINLGTTTEIRRQLDSVQCPTYKGPIR